MGKGYVLRWSIGFALCALVLDLTTVSAAALHGTGNQERRYSISSAWPPGVQSYLRVETSSTMYNILYRWGRTTAGANGAYGPNIKALRSSWFLEYQRAGAVDVIAGVLRGDDGMVADGLRMFHFGLAGEAPDGSFPGSAWPFHGTAMFLAEAAPALLVLAHSPDGARFAHEVNWQVALMRRAARHLVRVVGGVGKIDDRSKNHRFYEAALALRATGALAGDPTLQSWSQRYAWEGIAMERPDGVMPEDGGHDSGYQALGMAYGARYLLLLGHGSLYRALWLALDRGERWELSRVGRNGAVNQSGDTRTAGCRERNPVGACKTTFYLQIANALARWSVISGRQSYARQAYLVWRQNWAEVPGDVLPRPGVWVKPPEVGSGQWLTVWGAGFQPLETVTIYLGGRREQTIQCDQIGSFGGHSPQPNAHFPVPALPSGTYIITARGSFGTVKRTRVGITG